MLILEIAKGQLINYGYTKRRDNRICYETYRGKEVMTARLNDKEYAETLIAVLYITKSRQEEYCRNMEIRTEGGNINNLHKFIYINELYE